MDHESIAVQFNTFAFELVQKHALINSDITSLQDDVLLRRIIFNRYYYALYHKYMAHDHVLSSKSGPGIHDAILTKIRSCGDAKLLQVYLKLMNLRVWADYKLIADPLATTINLNTINNDVWSIIKRTTINC